MKSQNMVAKRIKPGKDEFDPNAPKVAKRTFQVNQELKSDTGEVVTPPVDDVTKYGPVDGDRLRQRKKFRLIKTQFDPNLAPGLRSKFKR